MESTDALDPTSPHDPIQKNTAGSPLAMPSQRDLGYDEKMGERISPEKMTPSLYSTQTVDLHEARNARKCVRRTTRSKAGAK
jgi:hypothetical protein